MKAHICFAELHGAEVQWMAFMLRKRRCAFRDQRIFDRRIRPHGETLRVLPENGFQFGEDCVQHYGCGELMGSCPLPSRTKTTRCGFTGGAGGAVAGPAAAPPRA